MSPKYMIGWKEIKDKEAKKMIRKSAIEVGIFLLIVAVLVFFTFWL